MIHKEILTARQIELLPFIKRFKSNFVLVGGTALALQIGHRRSIDFDLFSQKSFDQQRIIFYLQRQKLLDRVLVNSSYELTLVANQVKMTWYQFDYNLHPLVETDFAFMPSLLTLGAMKLFTLNGRAKWKDYVDLYVLLQSKEITLRHLIQRAKEVFQDAFSEKLARVQLAYFKDIDYTEAVTWSNGWKVDDDTIKSYLTHVSLTG